MIFNIVSGGLKSTVTVNTVAGASVTCVLSPFSYSATANSSGVATFTVYMKGTWTVTSTKSGLSNSGTVSITANAQSMSISLPLRYYLFKSGEGAKVTLNRSVGTESISLYGAVRTEQMIDVSNYSKFYIDGIQHDSGGTEIWFLLGTSTSAYQLKIGEFIATTRRTESIDISSYTGNNYVGVHFGSSSTATIYNFWLEL